MKSLNFKYIIDAIVRKTLDRVFVLAVVFVVSAVYIFSLPRYYKTQVQILPELSSESGISLPGNLSSLASLAGISTNLGGEDAINPDIYPDIFNSTTFILSLLDIQVKPDPHTTVSYYDYLTKGQKEPWWGETFRLCKRRQERHGHGHQSQLPDQRTNGHSQSGQGQPQMRHQQADRHDHPYDPRHRTPRSPPSWRTPSWLSSRPTSSATGPQKRAET